MPRRTTRLVLTLPLLLLVGTPAWAQPRDDVRTAPPTRELKARELFQEGSLLYEQAHYDEAIDRFQEAYRLSARPGLLFNIAQAYRLKGPAYCGTALRYYERHLHDEPTASNRAEIAELIEEMRVCAAAQGAPVTAPKVAETSPPPSAPPQPGAADLHVQPLAGHPSADQGPQTEPARPLRWPAWGAAAGMAMLLGGVAGYGAAWVKYSSVKGGGPYPRGTFSTWETVTYLSYGLIGAGAATAAVSLIILARQPDPDASGVSVSFGTSGARVQWRGRF
jgi:hypothetical protein